MATLTLKSSTSGYTKTEWQDYDSAPPSVDLEAGAVVEYLGHWPGGMVSVKYRDEEVIIHPAATVELG